mmetsp:Transcript_62143/g.173605  ORF Transcript_62143/g.173605 Transcript_62143/m.173605 type:complete len:288 (+) Transcript_62143:71-934(+)|eukprot:CAMPEP_0176235756 /NCGR_PEP_ID=MMETSP0121_2-20121125/26997_1 /TAXON_ID=160619 /ORGANISM="Kryptoperidinium foliaceum, Strain CCMP 1326" /LENGTH=287 /DNA_ID=CAMNT_0017575177 /DNA_START=71 /DNA_END=934 /DNA_ORIENTATION=+
MDSVELERMLRTLARAIETIDFPDKDSTWQLVQRWGRQHERKFPGYKFVPRGGLSSPHVRYMTDIDFIFNRRGGGLVDVSDFDSLERLAAQMCGGSNNIMSAQVSMEDEAKLDDETQDLRCVRALVAEGADVVVITGRMSLRSGWSVPMDFTLQCGDAKMSKAQRLEKIRGNLEAKNYAKVVQRMRALLPPDSKAVFAARWNDTGGALRFLVKQLDLLRFMPPREVTGYLPYLCIPSEPSHETWAEVAEQEMQRRALAMLRESRRLYEPSLGREAGDIMLMIMSGSA